MCFWGKRFMCLKQTLMCNAVLNESPNSALCCFVLLQETTWFDCLYYCENVHILKLILQRIEAQSSVLVLKAYYIIANYCWCVLEWDEEIIACLTARANHQQFTVRSCHVGTLCFGFQEAHAGLVHMLCMCKLLRVSMWQQSCGKQAVNFKPTRPQIHSVSAQM